MVKVSARFELTNLSFGLLRVDCKMKKIRRSLFSGLLFQGSSFSGTRFWVFTPNFSWVFVFGSVFQVLGLRFWGVFIFAMTINPHSFDTLKDFMWHSGFNWSLN